MFSPRPTLLLTFALLGILSASVLNTPSFATPSLNSPRDEISPGALPHALGWRTGSQASASSSTSTLDTMTARNNNASSFGNGLVARLAKTITDRRIGSLFSTHTGGPPCADNTFLWGDQCWGGGDCDSFKAWLADHGVGFNTWCAAHPKACARLQCSDECAVGTLTEQVIDIALREVGVHETTLSYSCPGSNNQGNNACKIPSSSAGIGSVDEYLASVELGPGNFWCAAFVRWTFEQAGRSLGCLNGCAESILNCGFTTDRTPAPGDIVVWNRPAICGVSSGEQDHMGIVVEVAPNGAVTTVEGNSNDQVSKNTHTSSESYIGFVSVPGVSRPTGCAGGGGAVSNILPGDPNFPPGSVAPRTHTICSGTSCLVVDGPGINQCDNSGDCQTSHTTCSGTQCIRVPEPGKDECIMNPKNPSENNNLIGFPGKCPLETHFECVNRGLGPQCAVVPGPGDDQCTKQTELTKCGNADIP